MGNRRKARELAIQILFNMEFNPGDPDEIYDLVYENFRPSRSIRVFSKKLVCGVRENIKYLDSIIRRSSKNWRLERMSVVDRSILRLASYEILFMEDIPHKVSIDEAVELGKKFGSEESGAFINGVLDNILKNITFSKSS
ncbi:MAG: transcription antitermination factor NusB [Deltaproteobacteria bacterium RBG_19FT_COMBO_46_9]|nr:MAG: transcription antitermination factor NusB [Deltaproteobacteria bacterium RBG_19FT_COMBO_46_9]